MVLDHIAGISSQKLSISEIGVSFPDETFGKESRFGIPFTVIARYIIIIDVILLFLSWLKGSRCPHPKIERSGNTGTNFLTDMEVQLTATVSPSPLLKNYFRSVCTSAIS